MSYDGINDHDFIQHGASEKRYFQTNAEPNAKSP